VSGTSSPTVRRAKWKILLIAAATFCVAALGLFFYVNTTSFQAMVRRRLIAEVERITGGRAEIGSIHTTPFRLQADVRDITVHGREASGDVPLAHVDRIVARLKISSLLRSELAFGEVILEQPIVHVAFYADGSTNFPPRKPLSSSNKTPVEQLFALSIDHFELRRGQLLWNDRNIPLDFAARDTSLNMEYSFLRSRYDGHLLVGRVDTKLLDYQPFAWMTTMEFSLGSNSATIPSLKWNSGHSHFSTTGQVIDFRRPHLQGSYDAQIDLREAATIARRRDVRSGVLELKGHGDWTLDQFSSEGALTIQGLGWQDERMSFSKASLNTGFSVTDQDLKFSKLQGKILGGSFSGDAEINRWLAAAKQLSAAEKKEMETAVISAAPPVGKSREKAAKPKSHAVQSAQITLRLRDLSGEELVSAFNPHAHPLPKFNPAASLSGTLETRWKGSLRDAETQFALDLTPPEHPSPAQLPVRAHGSGTFYSNSQTLELPQFSLATPTSHVQASGRLSSASALHLSVSTSSLADWLPVIAVVRGPALFPVVLNGSASFNGNMSGALTSPQLSGALRVEDFEINLPATINTAEIRTHWGSLSGSLQASFDAIALRNATLRRDDTSADFDASAALQHGHFTGDSAFTLRGHLLNGDFGDLQAFLGYNYPISGKTDLSVQASGTLASPRAEGQIHLSGATAYGQAVQQFDSNFRVGQGRIDFTNLHLLHDDSVVTGNAGYNPATRAFTLEVAGNNFDLAKVRQIQSDRLAVEGRADFVIKGSGTPDAPSIDSDVHIRNLTLDRELAGDLDLQGVTQGGELQLRGNSHLQHGALHVTGSVQLRDGYPADLFFQMDQLDLDVLWRAYFRGDLTGHSAVGGTIGLRGPLRYPAQWVLDGNLDAVAVEVEKIKLRNQDPVRFSVANQSLNIQRLHLLGEGTDFTAYGSVQLSGVRAIDLTADGRLDMKSLSSFDPNFNSSGAATVNMTIGGTFDDPLPQGRFQVANGAVAYAGLPSGLTELNGSLLFSRDRLHIETLSARTGGGTLDLKGDATYMKRQLTFDLNATGKDVRLRYPPGVSSTADVELHWQGTRGSSTLSGEIRVNKIAVTPGFDFSAYIERSQQISSVTKTSSPLNSIKLDVHVVTAPELQMRTAIARLSGDADLRIRGSLGRPAVLGRADILEGQATFHGTRFTLERGDITFANPVAIEAQLNLQASTHVRNYDLNITVTGTTNRGLNINYRSEPPLPKSDIVALLALGRTNGESAQLQEQSGQSAFSDQATAVILSQALNSTVSNRLQRLFGASNIKIDPQGLATETNPISTGPQITIEQEFANNVSLTYSTNVSQSSQQIIQGEYYFNRNISAVGTRDQNGVVSFDLQIRRRTK
jgi:translocation and assembly module TamB